MTNKQEGDAAAVLALEGSLRAQTHRLLAQVSAYVRGVVRVLGAYQTWLCNTWMRTGDCIHVYTLWVLTVHG